MVSRSTSKSATARAARGEAGLPPVAAASLPRLTEPCYCAIARQASRTLTELYERELAPFNITLPQFSLLRAAGALGPVTISEMAGKLKLDRTTLGRNLKLLEKDGLVEFLDNELDQRERLVGLTKAGGKLGEQAFGAWSAAQARVKRGLSKQKLEALREIVEEIELLAS